MSEPAMDLRIVALKREYAAVPIATLAQWAAEGRLAANDLVRPIGGSSWLAVAYVDELASRLPEAAAAGEAVPVAQPASQATPAAPQPPPLESPADPVLDDSLEDSPLDADDEIGWAPQRPRRRLEEALIDMTPMIDVTFQLLIFFMFTNSVANPNAITVPEAHYGRGVTPEGKQLLLIDEQGQYYLGESTKPENVSPSLDALVQEVSQHAAEATEPLDVIISAHKESRYLRVRELVERLSKVENLGKVMLGVEEKK